MLSKRSSVPLCCLYRLMKYGCTLGLVRVWEMGETRNETVTECLLFMYCLYRLMKYGCTLWVGEGLGDGGDT